MVVGSSSKALRYLKDGMTQMLDGAREERERPENARFYQQMHTQLLLSALIVDYDVHFNNLGHLSWKQPRHGKDGVNQWYVARRFDHGHSFSFLKHTSMQETWGQNSVRLQQEYKSASNHFWDYATPYTVAV
jgi:hypothetical protein